MKKNNKGGRPSQERPLPLYYDSMQACEADMCVPVAVQKIAKDAGCDGFRSNRVYPRPLIRWLMANEGDEFGINWNQRLAKVKTHREEHKLNKEQGSVLDKSKARQGIQSGVSIMFSTLERLLLGEAPAGMKGKTEMEIHRWGEARIEETRKDLTAKFAGIGESEE